MIDRFRQIDRFMLLVALLFILQLGALLVWEILGREMLLRAVARNPDALDRAFYGGVASGMRVAMLLALSLTAAGFLPLVRRQLRHVLVWPRLLPAALALSCILQLLVVYLLDTPPFSDSAFYVEHARRLLETGSYVTAEGAPTAFWPLGYPALLGGLGWLTGHLVIAGQLLNIVANLCLIVLAWRLFSPLLTPLTQGFFLLLLALHPIVLFSSVVLMTEPLYLLLTWSTVYLVVRMPASLRRSLLLGILLALAVYLRPAALLYAVILSAYLAWVQRSASQALLPLTVVVLLVAPWTLRNAEVFGRFVPVATNGGFNFLMGNHCNASGGLNYDFQYNPHGLNEAAAAEEAFTEGLNEIAACPGEALLRLPKKLIHAFRRADAPAIWAVKPIHDALPDWVSALTLYAVNGLHYLVLPIAFFGVFRIRVFLTDSSLRSMVLLVFAITIGTVLLFFGSDRFVLPLLPLNLYFFFRFWDRGQFGL